MLIIEFTALLQERRNREESDDESRLSSPSSLSISTVSSDQSEEHLFMILFNATLFSTARSVNAFIYELA